MGSSVVDTAVRACAALRVAVRPPSLGVVSTTHTCVADGLSKVGTCRNWMKGCYQASQATIKAIGAQQYCICTMPSLTMSVAVSTSSTSRSGAQLPHTKAPQVRLQTGRGAAMFMNRQGTGGMGHATGGSKQKNGGAPLQLHLSQGTGAPFGGRCRHE